MFLKSEFSQIR